MGKLSLTEGKRGSGPQAELLPDLAQITCFSLSSDSGPGNGGGVGGGAEAGGGESVVAKVGRVVWKVGGVGMPTTQRRGGPALPRSLPVHTPQLVQIQLTQKGFLTPQFGSGTPTAAPRPLRSPHPGSDHIASHLPGYLYLPVLHAGAEA